MADFAVMCSWEGDNTVMAQQTAKFLMKMYKQSLSGKKPLTGFEKYLENIPATLGEDLRVLIKSPKDLLNHSIQLKIMRKLAVGIIARTAGRLAKAVSNLKDKTKGWNEVMYALVQASRVHCDFYVIDCFIETVQSVPENPDGVRKMIEKLGHLHTLFTMNKYLGLALLEEKVLTSEQAIWIEDNMYAICKDIRKDAVPLVDSFNFPDFVLNTPLGRYDGQVYKHYLETVKRAPNAIGVPEYFESDIKPLLMGSK
jgi:acyl-CoA oxidase